MWGLSNCNTHSILKLISHSYREFATVAFRSPFNRPAFLFPTCMLRAATVISATYFPIPLYAFTWPVPCIPRFVKGGAKNLDMYQVVAEFHSASMIAHSRNHSLASGAPRTSRYLFQSTCCFSCYQEQSLLQQCAAHNGTNYTSAGTFTTLLSSEETYSNSDIPGPGVTLMQDIMMVLDFGERRRDLALQPCARNTSIDLQNYLSRTMKILGLFMIAAAYSAGL